MKAVALPELPAPFPPAFRTMLDQILRKSARIRGARREAVRARHRALVQTGTFAGHRSYVQGDDLRRLDWNAYARTGGLYVKLLEDDEQQSAAVVVDSSPSMWVGQTPRLCTALRLAAILGGLSLLHLDGVHLRVGSEEALLAGRGQLPALLEQLGRTVAASESANETVDALLARGAPGKLHWISDFAQPAAYERPLQRLRRTGRRVVGWLPELPEDLTIEPGGWTSVVDPETGREMPVAIDAALCRALRAELQSLRRQQQQLFTSCGFPLQRLRLPSDSFQAGAWLEAGWSFRR